MIKYFILQKVRKRIQYLMKLHSNVKQHQLKLLLQKIYNERNSKFSKEYEFKNIASYNEYVERVPVSTYENSINMNYIQPDIYVCTSGSTTTTKYIPSNRKEIKTHLTCIKDVIMSHMLTVQNIEILKYYNLVFYASKSNEKLNDISCEKLSYWLNEYKPFLYKKRVIPSFKVNEIENSSQKIDAIIQNDNLEKIYSISGLPMWITIFLEELEKRNKSLPNLKLIMTGGMSSELFEPKINNLLGFNPSYIHVYNASEAFIGFNSTPNNNQEYILHLDNGVFYEFIPFNNNIFPNLNTCVRIPLWQIATNQKYVLLLTTEYLWSYVLGDVVEFKEINPYKFVFAGRIHEYISLFNERISLTQVEKAIKNTFPFGKINNFFLTPANEKDKYELFIDFTGEYPSPEIKSEYEISLDSFLRKINTHYDILREEKLLLPIHITYLKSGTFEQVQLINSSFGNQFKIKRISNNRDYYKKLFSI